MGKGLLTPRAISAPRKPLGPALSPAREGATERLAELGVVFDQTTHEAKKTGRAISISRRDTEHLDNAPGTPARIRDAWTTCPRMEFFGNGIPVAPPDPDAATTETERDGSTGP